MNVLTTSQIERFIERGYVHLHQAFSSEQALLAQQDIWERLARDEVLSDDPCTWKEPIIYLNETLHTHALSACKTDRLKDAVEDLVGVGRWLHREDEDGWGWWPVNFSLGADQTWEVPAGGWHWDGIHFRHSINSPEQGLLMLCIFSSIESHGGATLVAEGSHKIVARFLQAQPEALDLNQAILNCKSCSPWLADLTETQMDADTKYDKEDFNMWKNSGDRTKRFMENEFMDDYGSRLLVKEAVGEPGDIYLCHPFLFHAASQNHLHRPRFMCNKTSPLREPMQFLRDDHDFSPLERSILIAISDVNKKSEY